MKAVFLDTNILIDLLADRKPHAELAAQIFNFGIKNRIKIYVSAISFNNIYFILRKFHSHKPTIDILLGLKKMVSIIEVSEIIIENALNSNFNDFEDSIQYHCAKEVNEIDCIITRDPKGFKNSTLAILSPFELICLIESIQTK